MKDTIKGSHWTQLVRKVHKKKFKGRKKLRRAKKRKKKSNKLGGEVR